MTNTLDQHHQFSVFCMWNTTLTYIHPLRNQQMLFPMSNTALHLVNHLQVNRHAPATHFRPITAVFTRTDWSD